MLFTIVAIATALASVSIHELGHAYAMRQCGVRVISISLLGIPGLGTFRLPIRSRFFPGTNWYLHPLIIGAYVEPEEKDMEGLSRRDALYIYGMGPLMNILFTLVVALIFVTLTLALDMFGRSRGVPPPWGKQMMPLVFVGLGAIITALWYFRRLVCQFVLLPIGWWLAITMVYFVFTKSGMPVSGLSDQIGDIHRVGPKMMEGMPQSVILEIVMAIVLGTGLSVILGLTNLLPLVPLDGGHMMRFALPVAWRDAYIYLTAPIFAILILLQFGKDFYNLGRWMFGQMFW